jgi:hypothetical protein
MKNGHDLVGEAVRQAVADQQQAMQAQPQDGPVMEGHEAIHMVNVGFAEFYGGFVRRVNAETGQHEWRPGNAPEDAPWVESPPLLQDDENALLPVLTSFVKAQGGHGIPMISAVEYAPPAGASPFRVRLGVIEGENQVRMIAEGHSDVLDCAIAIAMLNANQYNFRELHRTLFPARYLAGANDG